MSLPPAPTTQLFAPIGQFVTSPRTHCATVRTSHPTRHSQSITTRVLRTGATHCDALRDNLGWQSILKCLPTGLKAHPSALRFSGCHPDRLPGEGDVQAQPSAPIGQFVTSPPYHYATVRTNHTTRHSQSITTCVLRTGAAHCDALRDNLGWQSIPKCLPTGLKAHPYALRFSGCHPDRPPL